MNRSPVQRCPRSRLAIRASCGLGSRGIPIGSHRMAPSMVILALLPPVAVFLGSPGGTVTVTVLAAIGVPFQDGHHDETEKRDLVSDGDESRVGLGGASRSSRSIARSPLNRAMRFLGFCTRFGRLRLLYRCPKCGCEGKLWQPDEVGSPILCVRPLVAARHILRFDPAQIARLARILTEIGDKIEWVLGRVLVQARALARRIKAAKAVPARS